MFCSNCGNKLSGEGKFCSSCGNPIDNEEIQQQSTYIETNNEEATTKIKTTTLPKIKSKMAIIALAIVIVLAVGFMAKDYIIYAVSPELSTKMVLSNTMKNLSKDYRKMESLLFGYDKSNLSNSVGVNFKIEGVNHSDMYISEDLSLLKGMGMSMTTTFDDKNKELYFNGSYDIEGESFVSIDAKLDDNELVFNIPQLFDELLRFPSKTFGREWNNSYAGQEMYLPIEDTLDISISNLIKNSNMEDMDTKTKDAYMNSMKLIFEDAYYEKDGSANLMIGNISRKCNKTTVTLNNESVKRGIISLLDSIKSDNRMKYWADNFGQEFNYYEFEESIEEMKNEVMENYEMDKIVIDLFSNGGNIVKSEIQVVVDEDYEEGTLLCNIELLGSKSMIDDIKFEVLVDNEGLTFESKGNHTGNNNIFADKTKIVIRSYYGDDIIVESSTEIDFSKKKDNLKADIRLIADGGEISLNTKGSFNSSTKSNEFQSDEIYFSYKDNYDTIKMSFSGLISRTSDVSKKPNFNDYKKLDVLKMDEYDLYNFANSIEENAYWLGERIQQILGYY